LSYYDGRRVELAEFLPASVRNRLLEKFLGFLAEMGVPPFLSSALPSHVACFLAARDARGATQVHDIECPMLGTNSKRGDAECACPFRAAASAVDTVRGTLRGLFRDHGMVGDWCPQTGKGNPCVSREVDEYVMGVQREQLQSGVSAKKAALFDESVFNALMDSVWAAWLQARDVNDLEVELSRAQDALMYAILWETGLRMSDALNLLAQDVTPLRTDAPYFRGIQLRVNLTKTAKKASQARLLKLPNGSSPNSVPRAFVAYADTAKRCGLPINTGFLFRMVDVEGPVFSWGARLTRPDMAARFRDLANVTGIPTIVTVHSFHPSKAARLRAEGVPTEEICGLLDWTVGTFGRYLEGRFPMTWEEMRPLLRKT
jgi:hypothetical protein